MKKNYYVPCLARCKGMIFKDLEKELLEMMLNRVDIIHMNRQYAEIYRDLLVYMAKYLQDYIEKVKEAEKSIGE